MVTDAEKGERERLLEALDSYERGLSDAPYLRKWSDKSGSSLRPSDITAQGLLTADGVEGAGGRMSFVVSTDEVDRHWDVVSVNGWRLQSYGRSPVFLWAHDYTQPAIGGAVNMWREEHGLLATMEFAPTVSPAPPSTGDAPSGSRGWVEP